MKSVKAMLLAIALVSTLTGCYTHKERVVERERPVVQERVIETPGETTIHVR